MLGIGTLLIAWLYAKTTPAWSGRYLAVIVGPLLLLTAYYLPAVARFATPLGAVPDPRVMNWRDALTRFEHSSVLTALAPMVRALPAGRRVLLVVPTSFQKTPRWMSLIHRSSRRWLSYLRHDPRLRLIKVSAFKAHASNLPVRGWLFVGR